ncbi:hypothetical protein CDD83_5665 [Cordyceps sp. RAO-2017]|nr:hypothetical protein CDD83_5665 [Cordyceps sp. RAO-2017]
MAADSAPLPSSQRAIKQGADGQPVLVEDAAIPPLPPGFALIKTRAVALNPSDNKLLANFPCPGAYVGADFAGTVVRVADDVGAAGAVEPGDERGVRRVRALPRRHAAARAPVPLGVGGQ